MVPDTNSISINELPGVATSHNNVEYCFNYSKFNHVVLQIKLVKFPLKSQLSYLHTKRLLTATKKYSEFIFIIFKGSIKLSSCNDPFLDHCFLVNFFL